MNSIDWTILRSFLAVVETGSLSAAAARVGVSQPTLGRHVRELETALGFILFVRSVRGLAPTDAALGLIDEARAMGAAADAFALKATGRSHRLEGTVRLSASVVAASLILPPILVALRAAEPLIQIELVASDLNQNLLRRDADLAVRMIDPVQDALIVRKLGETPIGLFGARAYLARRGRPETAADLASHDLIGFDRSDALVKGLAVAGVAIAREGFAVRSDDQMACWNLLLAGAGLGFAQTMLARRCPELELLDLGLHMPSLPIWLVMHEDVRTSARIRRVADFLTTALIDLLRNA